MHIRTLSLALLLILGSAPATTHAAFLHSGRTVVISEPSTENVYIAASDVTVAAPLSADLVAAGGTLGIASTVGGDALLAGGSVELRKPVAGDVRAAAGEFLVDSDIGGDLMVAAGRITASSTAKTMHLAGGTIRIAGSGGTVEAYGADIYLSGTIRGDVKVTASDKLFIAESTRIEGTLSYDAPQEVVVPATATITGGVTYMGSSTFLPTNEEAKRFAIAGAGVLLVVRIIAIVIAAGLVVGLFPLLANMVVERSMLHSPRRSVLYALLGFATIVVTPVLILFLLISFVGIALGVLLSALYVFLLLLAYLYAGLIAGAALYRAVFKKEYITWRTAVLGTFALYAVSAVPVFGFLVVCVLTCAALGALIAITYQAAFGRTDTEESVVVEEEAAI